MGTIFSQYDPFSIYGQHNLKNYAYQNKRNLLLILTIALMLVVGAIIMVWTNDTDQSIGKPHYNIPPPRYGFGVAPPEVKL